MRALYPARVRNVSIMMGALILPGNLPQRFDFHRFPHVSTSGGRGRASTTNRSYGFFAGLGLDDHYPWLDSVDAARAGFAVHVGNQNDAPVI